MVLKEVYVSCDVTDIYYETGLSLTHGVLVLSSQEIYLVVDGRYRTRAEKIKGVTVCPLENEGDLSLLRRLGVQRVGVDAEQITHANFLRLQEALPKAEVVPIDNPIAERRLCKSKEELDKLAAAGEMGARGYDYALSLLTEGVTEVEIAREIERFWLAEGADGLSFPPIIAFGEATACPHYDPGATPLQEGMAVLLDMGVKLDRYCSDMTRTHFFGEPPEKFVEIYEAVAEAQRRALEACKPGVLIGELDRIARNCIEEVGYGEAFCHGLGHGVGLDIHEPPYLRRKGIWVERPLEEGMVVTIEPGIYLPGFAGVRIEDTVAITEEGYLNLTNRKIGYNLA